MQLFNNSSLSFRPIFQTGSGFFKQLSPQYKKLTIIAVVALAFVMLGTIVYSHFFRPRKINVVLESKTKPPQEVITHVSSEILSVEPPLLEKSPPIEIQTVEVKMNPSKVFKILGALTVPVELIPYTRENCQFKDILPPKDTLVEVEGNSDSLYLHANHVKLEGIAMILAQYPLQEHLPLFWRLSCQASLILDLTNDKDLKGGIQKYAPPLSETFVYDHLLIKCLNQSPLTGLNATLYTYDVEFPNSNGLSFEIKRIHYEGWDDHQGISEIDMDKLIKYIQDYTSNRAQPVIIHCRAGVGRSGTVATAFALSHLIKNKKITSSNLLEAISHLILEGRKQRGPGFVQNSKQLSTIWKWAKHALQLK